jgi:hypothetical protein
MKLKKIKKTVDGYLRGPCQVGKASRLTSSAAAYPQLQCNLWASTLSSPLREANLDDKNCNTLLPETEGV